MILFLNKEYRASGIAPQQVRFRFKRQEFEKVLKAGMEAAGVEDYPALIRKIGTSSSAMQAWRSRGSYPAAVIYTMARVLNTNASTLLSLAGWEEKENGAQLALAKDVAEKVWRYLQGQKTAEQEHDELKALLKPTRLGGENLRFLAENPQVGTALGKLITAIRHASKIGR